MIAFNCPRCRELLRVTDDNAGRHTWCRSCQRVVLVPAALAAARSEAKIDVRTPESALQDRGQVVALKPRPVTSITDAAQLDDLRKEVSRLRAELADVRADRDRARESHSDFLNALRIERDAAVADRDRMQEELRSRDVRLSSMTSDLERAESELETARAESAPQDHAKIADLESQIQTLRYEATIVHQQITDRDRELELLKEQLDELDIVRTKADALDSAQQEAADLRAQLAAYREAGPQKDAEVSALHERIRSLESKRIELTEQLTESNRHADAAEERAAETGWLRDRVQTLESELARLKTQTSETDAQKSSETASLQGRVEHLESENRGLQEQLAEANRRADSGQTNESELAGLRDRVQALESEKAIQAEALTDAKQRADTAAERAEHVETSLAKQRHDAVNQERLLAETRRDLERKSAEFEALRHAAESQSPAAAPDTENVARLEQELQEVRAELDRKADEINSLAAELESERTRTQQAAARIQELEEMTARAESAMTHNAAPESPKAVTLDDDTDHDARRARESKGGDEDDMLDALMRFLGRQ